MKLTEKELKDITKYIEKGYKFIGRYSGYFTGLSGETVQEAITHFYHHYNAILSFLIDVRTNDVYRGKENNDPDCRGYFNYSYYNIKTDEMVFNVDELTQPIIKIKSVPIDKSMEHGYIDRDGKFYKCGFERHRSLAKELFLSETIKKPYKYNKDKAEEHLEEMGWVKISSKRIHFKYDYEHPVKLTDSQKKTIIKYMDIIGDEIYEYQYSKRTKFEIEQRMNERD